MNINFDGDKSTKQIIANVSDLTQTEAYPGSSAYMQFREKYLPVQYTLLLKYKKI